MQAKLIATFGLDEEENAYIEKHLPQKECEIMGMDVVMDTDINCKLMFIFGWLGHNINVGR